VVQYAVWLQFECTSIKLRAQIEIATLQGDGAKMHCAHRRIRRLQFDRVLLRGVEKAKMPKNCGALVARGLS